MHFLMATVALAASSAPASAMDLPVVSRAIPPADAIDAVPAPPPVTILADRRDAISAKKVRPSSGGDDRQQICIAQAVYYESKSEPARGQRAVADVIINRTRRPGFAATPCGVILQPHQFTNARRWAIPSASDPLWQRAREVARNAMAGIGSVSAVITHFHAVRAGQGFSMRRFAVIGGHVFYRS